MENIKDCKIEIRKMILKDLESISNILYSDFDDFWSYEVLASELCSENSSYFVAIQNNEIIGFAGFKIICDEAEIMNIVVRKSARGIGIGSLLLNHLLFEIHNSDLNVVNLEVDSSNFVAIKLYEKFGFRQVGFRKGYYGNDGAILMTRRDIWGRFFFVPKGHSGTVLKCPFGTKKNRPQMSLTHTFLSTKQSFRFSCFPLFPSQ